MKLMKKGLVLEGGAMRGLFTCGVIDVFLENDIRFDGAVGISAGAVLAATTSLASMAVLFATTPLSARIPATAPLSLF